MAAKYSNYGLILCGGNSTRMGMDKGLLTYREKPQCYHLYDLLQGNCNKVFISCNPAQSKVLDHRYTILPDLEELESIGPMAGLLTAFHDFPGNDFLVIGCDYPFLSKNDITSFLDFCQPQQMAAAFYHPQEEVYEPLLAWYSRRAAGMLTESFNKQQYSLQHFLRSVNAQKYEPTNPAVMVSANTPEAMQKAKEQIRKSVMSND